MSDQPAQRPEGKLLEEALEASNLSQRKAAQAAGISEGWWRQIVRGYQSLSGGGYGPVRGPANTLARMALAVDLQPEDLENAGREDAADEMRTITGSEAQPDPSEDLGITLRDETERYLAQTPGLTADQRVSVIMIVRSVRDPSWARGLPREAGEQREEHRRGA